MFRAFPRPSSGAQWLQWQPLVLPSYHGDSRAMFVVRSPAAFGFTFVSCWQPCCVRGRATGSLWFYLRIMVTAVPCSWSGHRQPLALPSYRGDSRAVFVVGPLARPWTQHGCHPNTKVKPEAATAVIELLMMGGETPETCWAVNECQDNELENCCIRLVIYLNCTAMMHGLTNLKFINVFTRAHNMSLFWARLIQCMPSTLFL